ncbi:MAG TPA: DNA polymerase III subunit beta [Candidatus Paceibacterota bacterium]|nr:DNA polymerase III subunit beta [Candidatus Paceibacterota bacterium]
MNISIDKKELGDAMGVVSRFAERRGATLPVLGGIAIIATKESIRLCATNLETGIDLTITGSVKTPGNIALPATVLKEITSSFSGTGVLTLEQTGDTALISSGSAKSTIKTLSYEDFPTLSVPESSKTSFTLSGTILRNLIQSVASCASPSTVRPELASILLSAEGGVVKAVATDSFRLAEKKVSVSGKVEPFSILIPAKNALDIAQTLPDDEIKVQADAHQCSFSFKNGVVVTRLVAASYPDYAQIIPKTSVAEATILKKDFEAGLRRASVFTDAFQKVRLGLDVGKKQLILSARNADVGETSESLPVAASGDSIELSFNHRYLQAPIPLITTESLTLSAAGIGRPLVIRGQGDTSFLYLVMPMNQ